MTVTQLREGDYRPDGAGGFALATGGAGVLERVLFLLTARRGGFPLLPEVGSRLYLLSRARPSARGALGASYAAEALAGEENLRVLGAVWTEETRTLTVELEWQGEPMQAVLDAAALGWQDRRREAYENSGRNLPGDDGSVFSGDRNGTQRHGRDGGADVCPGGTGLWAL